MAHGRYRLLAAVGEDGVHLEDKSLARKEEVAWSAGLADQVYLSIRLGLAREFGRHSEPVPVILDDVLVKFDPARRQNAARVILDFAREQQVLLFSCHPEFVDLIAAVRRDPGHQDTALACFAIADGVINQVSMGPGDALPAAMTDRTFYPEIFPLQFKWSPKFHMALAKDRLNPYYDNNCAKNLSFLSALSRRR